jgi:hypothetical protein
MNKEPKIEIEVIDGKWVVKRGAYCSYEKVMSQETKIFLTWGSFLKYLEENLTH